MMAQTPTQARTRILLVEDHQMVREGLAALFRAEPDLEICGEAPDGEIAVKMCGEVAPDVVVMDLGLPGIDGVEATRQIHLAAPDVPVVVLTMHDDAPTVDRALRAGARAYVVKGAGFGRLCDAVRSACRGEAYLSPDVSGYVVNGYLQAGDGVPLSEREREILKLIADGHTSTEIAGELGLRPKTVENHRANIMEKLDIHTTAGLVRYALQKNIAK